MINKLINETYQCPVIDPHIHEIDFFLIKGQRHCIRIRPVNGAETIKYPYAKKKKMNFH